MKTLEDREEQYPELLATHLYQAIPGHTQFHNKDLVVIFVTLFRHGTVQHSIYHSCCFDTE